MPDNRDFCNKIFGRLGAILDLHAKIAPQSYQIVLHTEEDPLNSNHKGFF